MPKEHQKHPAEMPIPVETPDISNPIVPEELPVPDNDPDVIPEESPFETPPVEMPEPGEGP